MNPYSRPMKHIQREDLYTNLEVRIQYLHSFLDFSSRTCYTHHHNNAKQNLKDINT